jgi:serine/threonine-protein kinase RsbW
VPPPDDDSRTVSLTVPARADYLVLARLALSAVCRLTRLAPDEVVDLKLAVTEAASGVLNENGAGPDGRLEFRFHLLDDRLALQVQGDEQPGLSPEERQLGRAIIEATVDEYDEDGATVRLVKYLKPGQ